jgi:hypothetical protein
MNIGRIGDRLKEGRREEIREEEEEKSIKEGKERESIVYV